MNNDNLIQYNKLYIMLINKLINDKKQLCLIAKKIQSNKEYKLVINTGLNLDIKELDLIDFINKQDIFYIYFTKPLTKNEKIKFLSARLKELKTELYELNYRLSKINNIGTKKNE